MTIHQHIKSRLSLQGFNASQAKAIIATCLAFDRAREYRKYWDGDMQNVPAVTLPKLIDQANAIARAWKQTFTKETA